MNKLNKLLNKLTYWDMVRLGIVLALLVHALLAIWGMSK